MKKWTALLLALVMCLSLCACGGGDKNKDKIGQEASSENEFITDVKDDEIKPQNTETESDTLQSAGTYTISEFLGTGRHIFYELWDNRSDEYVGKDGYTSTIYVIENGRITKYDDLYYLLTEDSDDGYDFNYFGSLAKMTDDEICELLEANSLTIEDKLRISGENQAKYEAVNEKYMNGEITFDQLDEEKHVISEPERRPIKWPESPLELAVFTDNSGNNTDFEQLFFMDAHTGVDNTGEHIIQKLIGAKMSKIYNGTTPVYDSNYSEIRIYTTDYPDSERYWVFRNNEGINLIYDSPNNSDLLVDPKQEAVEKLFN